jgi:hypothetical protein
MKKAFLIALIGTPIIIILWVAGILNGLPLIPDVSTNYYVGDQSYRSDVVILDNKGDELSMRIDSDCGPGLQCIDVSIYPDKGEHTLTINRITITARSMEDVEFQRKYFYVYTSAGEMPGPEVIVNYPVGIADSDSLSTYVLLRSVFETSDMTKFKLSIDANYTYDGQPRRLENTFDVEKATKLTWKEFTWKEH